MPPLSLRGENLRGRNFTREARRKGQDFLRGADLRGADLRGARLRGLDLSGADLQRAQLQGADFRRTKLVGAYLQQVVTGVRWRASVLKGVVGLLGGAVGGFLWAVALAALVVIRHDKDVQPWGDMVAAAYGGLILLQLGFLVRRGVLPALSVGLSLFAFAGVVAGAGASADAGAGAGGAYARKDLRGAYLVEANLRGADLSEADVSGAAGD